jgi:hypothetical protein
MNKIIGIAILLFTIPILTLSTCKREVTLTPPPGARVLEFTQNTHVKTRAIYQGQADGNFKSGDTSHTYWVGITGEMPSHRLHARLLGNLGEISFTLRFPHSNVKIVCTAGAETEITGCTIPAQALKEREALIEVFAPRGLKLEKDPEYRLFIGIEGDKPLKFYSAGPARQK